MAKECEVCDSKLTSHESECPNCGSKLNFTMSLEVTETANPQAIELAPTLEDTSPHPNDEKTVVGTPELAKPRALKPNDSLLNMQIGGCVIKKQIGKGGMGCVYLAQHMTLDIPVAIKILHRDFAERCPEVVERFLKEARAVARLKHPNIVTAFNAGYENDLYFMVMEYVEGKNLAEVLSNPFNLPMHEALKLIQQISQALEYAHENGIIHRDLKPENIFLDKKGNAKVGDLGLAKDLNEDQSMTSTMSSMGTPYYISPEQATSAKNVDHRADIYSLGCTFFRIFCGSVPFKGRNSFDTVNKHLNEPVPDPKKSNPEMPNELSNMIQKMMQKEVDNRYQSMSEISQEISHLQNNLSESKLNAIANQVKEQTANFGLKIVATLMAVIAVILLIVRLTKPEDSVIKEKNSNSLSPVVLLNAAQEASREGQFFEARKLYEKILSQNDNLIDIHLNFSALLKQQEGIEGARETYNKRLDKTPGTKLAKALLNHGKARREAMGKLIKTFPEFTPAFYFAALAWNNDPSSQTFYEKNQELSYLEKFKELNEKGQFLKYFINKEVAEDFRSKAFSRLDILTRIKPQLELPINLQLMSPPRPNNPSVIIGSNSTQKHMLRVNISTFEYQHTRKIYYAFQQEGPFKDTGNLTTNSLSPNPLFHLEDHDKAVDIYVKYEDAKGYTNGPFKFIFDIPKEKISSTKNTLNLIKQSWIMYRNFDNRLLVYFTSILTYAKSIKEIRYSLGSNQLDKVFTFNEVNIYENVYIDIPKTTEKIFIQIEFKDGSKSETGEFKKPENL